MALLVRGRHPIDEQHAFEVVVLVLDDPRDETRVLLVDRVALRIECAHSAALGPANLGEYLGVPAVVAVGGSWMVPADRIATHDRAGLVDLISAAVRTARAVRPAA